MNTELKNLIGTIFDGEKFVQDIINKGYPQAVADAMLLLTDAEQDVANWSDILTEMKALAIPLNQQDLLSFVEQKLVSIPALGTAYAQGIIGAVVGFMTASYALEQAIAKT